MDEKVKKDLKYRLIMLEYCDDPVARAYLLKKVKDIFEMNKIEIPKEFKEFFDRETMRIAKKIIKKYHHILKKHRENTEVHHDKSGIWD